MEYLPERLHHLLEVEGRFPVEQAVNIAHQICRGLEAAYDAGVEVHRDIKPQNVLVAPDGTMKVTDFGIARAADVSGLTATGAVIGTPHYMSPEQARGERATSRSDIYSIGITLYQMLSGELPFIGDTPLAVLEKHRTSTPKKIRQLRSDVPKSLESIIDRCLAKDPDRRFQSPRELAQALQEAVPTAISPLPRPRVAAPSAPAPTSVPEQPRPSTRPPPAPDSASFCTKCGAGLHSGQQFCTTCGSSVIGSPATGASSRPPRPTPTTRPSARELSPASTRAWESAAQAARRWPLWARFLALTALVAVVGGGIFLALRASTGGSDPPAFVLPTATSAPNPTTAPGVPVEVVKEVPVATPTAIVAPTATVAPPPTAVPTVTPDPTPTPVPPVVLQLRGLGNAVLRFQDENDSQETCKPPAGGISEVLVEIDTSTGEFWVTVAAEPGKTISGEIRFALGLLNERTGTLPGAAITASLRSVPVLNVDAITTLTYSGEGSALMRWQIGDRITTFGENFRSGLVDLNHACRDDLEASSLITGNPTFVPTPTAVPAATAVPTPIPTATLVFATTVDMQTSHTCALTTAGGVKCWGTNSALQLGAGITAHNRLTPGDVAGLTSGVTAIALGGTHNCVLTEGGGVKCWGVDHIGDGTATERSSPGDVAGLTSGVVDISAGDSHTCAVTTTGGVKCWGNNASGQLGDGTTTDRSTPVDVVGLSSGVVAVSAEAGYNCVLTVVGGVKCWGRNDSGQLGDGTTTHRSTPVDVVGLTSGVASVSAGSGHTCVVTTEGGVECWGSNSTFQLGDGTTTDRTTPVEVAGLTSGVATVTAGWRHTCALTTTGGVKCWGSNGTGQLGNGVTTQQAKPVDVAGLTSGVTVVDAGEGGACAVTIGGGLRCWGSNRFGQLGDGSTFQRSTPVDVETFAVTMVLEPWEVEYAVVQLAVTAMIVANDLSALPKPFSANAGLCITGTQDMAGFPDASIVAVDKVTDANGNVYTGGVAPLAARPRNTVGECLGV